MCLPGKGQNKSPGPAPVVLRGGQPCLHRPAPLPVCFGTPHPLFLRLKPAPRRLRGVFPLEMGRAQSRGTVHPCIPHPTTPQPPRNRPQPRHDLFPGALRSHHAILYAGLGGASSARSDEQPGLGVHPERVQRERGPVELHTPAPAHPARAFTAGPAEPATCRAPPSTAAEPGAAAGGKADGPPLSAAFLPPLKPPQVSPLCARTTVWTVARRRAVRRRRAPGAPLRAGAGRQSASALGRAGRAATEPWHRIRFRAPSDGGSAIFVWGVGAWGLEGIAEDR